MHRVREGSKAVETERPRGLPQGESRNSSGVEAAWKSSLAPASAEGRGTNKSGAELGLGIHACRAELMCLPEHLRNTEEVKMARRRIGPSSRF